MTLKIIVMMKQVPDAEEIFIDPVTYTLNRTAARGVINIPDENALEIALQIKDKVGAEVTVISMGPPQAEEAIIECMGRGADRGILITDRAFAAADTYATSLTLAATIDKIGKYDIILAGESTTDSGTGHVGPGVAEFLDIDQVTYAESAEVVDDKIRVKRILEDADEVVEVPFPVLVTVLTGANIPRRATLRRKIDAIKKGIERWDHETLGLPPDWIGIRGSPTIVGAVKVPEEKKRASKKISLEQIPEMIDELFEKGIIKREDGA